MPMVQFVSVKINVEKAEVPPFGQVDTACYSASLLGKAVLIYPSPSLLVSQTVSTRERQVRFSYMEGEPRLGKN